MADERSAEPLPSAPLAVIGAGTMGAGIAQVCATGGFEVLLFDAVEGAATSAAERIETQLLRLVEKGRLPEAEAASAVSRIRPVASLNALADCFFAVEAAPEDLRLKQELFEELAEVCSPQTVLASNTSSLPVTSIASAVPHPQRVVGMHFFNPVPLMRLVEVVAGRASDQRSIAITHAVAERMGKVAIDAADVAGFLVNRVSRPFLLEAQRLLGEHVESHDTIDRVVRLGGGFRMGPFELSDLVGVDVGFDIAQSFYSLSFGEPRWQPSPIAAQLVAAGHHGRKSGRGYYEYAADGSYREPDPELSFPESAEGTAEILGRAPVADELRRLAKAAGYDVPAYGEHSSAPATVIVDARIEGAGRVADRGRSPVIVLCAGGSLATLAGERDAVGFHCLPPLGESHLVELVRGDHTSDGAVAAATHFFRSIGKHVEWVGDGPGLVLGRIVCQLINEAAFAVQEQVGSPEDIDQGVKLGLNYPRGLLEWGDQIGLEHVLATLVALQAETGSDRYRPAPLLRRMVATGKSGRHAGRGFHSYSIQE